MHSDKSELGEVSTVLRSSSILNEVIEPLQAEETSSRVMKKKEEKTKEIKKAIVKWLLTFLFLFFFFFKTLRLNL